MLMPDDAFGAAALPLFSEGAVDALSWSFEAGWDRPMPAWVAPLLDQFAAAGRLTGHGIRYSPLSVTTTDADAVWLDRVSADCRRRDYLQVSEHFGFMTAGDFVRGAPLPVPRSRTAIRVGRERLARLADATGRPVGLENLALAFSADDARAHGELLGELTDAPDRFILLDLHNLYCQAVNFGLDAEALISTYPLDRVREIHVSGGRMATPTGRPFRRDTHDAAVPVAVLDLVPCALSRCPNVHAVILEQLPGSLFAPEAAAAFQADFRALRSAVDSAGASATGAHGSRRPATAPLEDDTATLAALQVALLRALDTEPTPAAVRARLLADAALSPYRAWLAGADDRALETARELVATWGRRVEAG
jgi:uncharacterized protein (UPF0276 family)